MVMPKDLFFRRLSIKNWKNFVKADFKIPGRLFLVGPNASGKSNLLDLFRFLRDLALPGGGFQEAVSRRGGVKMIRSLASRRHSDIEIAVELESKDGRTRWMYEIVFNQDTPRRASLRKERVLRNDVEILTRPTPDDHRDPIRLSQTFLEQINANQEFREIYTFFASIRYIHIVPQLIRDPDRVVGQPDDPFGVDLIEQIAKTPERTRNARLRLIQKALSIAVPQLEVVELWRDIRGTPHLRGKYKHWRPQGTWQTEEQFSDGTLRLIGLLWVILEGGGPLLLEEPELSLHPDIIRVLPQIFARAQRSTGRQIIVSTHAPDLLRDEGIGLDEVLLMVPGREGTEVRPAGSYREIEELLKGGLTLADAVFPITRPEGIEQLSLFE
jgi:predicted ATPase